MQMALQEGWTSVEVTPPSNMTDAGAIKTWLQSIVGNHKRASIFLDFDWSNGAPTVNRQLVMADLFDGFDSSFYARYNTNNSFGGYGTLPSNTDYWTNSYSITANTTDKYIVFIDTNS